MSQNSYVHGYSARESERLADQANTLMEWLHPDTRYPAGSHILEAGCGVGAQTVFLAARHPDCRITSVEISPASLAAARQAVQAGGFKNVEFLQGDIYKLPYADEQFDHIFVCFVLEHLPRPLEALQALRRVLKQGGTLTAIEGDHGSTFFHPDSAPARRAVQALVEAQARAGGDALIGRRLYPLLRAAGYEDIRVTPRTVYVDGARPALADGFTRKTFAAMVEGARPQVAALGLMPLDEFDLGVRDLYRCAEPDGTFIYLFFKAVGIKGSGG